MPAASKLRDHWVGMWFGVVVPREAHPHCYCPGAFVAKASFRAQALDGLIVALRDYNIHDDGLWRGSEARDIKLGTLLVEGFAVLGGMFGSSRVPCGGVAVATETPFCSDSLFMETADPKPATGGEIGAGDTGSDVMEFVVTPVAVARNCCIFRKRPPQRFVSL